MLQAISAFKRYAIEASDGWMGKVSDFLFDDLTWKVRWIVVDTGRWLPGRKILIPPSAIEQADDDEHQLFVKLTKAQVESSPNISDHQPVSQQVQRALCTHYGWDPFWGGSSLVGSFGAIASPLSAPPYLGITSLREKSEIEAAEAAYEAADPHLRSVAEVVEYHIHAVDGEIGHLENFMMDRETWTIHYLVVDTRNWWFGKHVLISPSAINEIVWSERHVRLNVTRDQVKSSPPWDPTAMIDLTYQTRLHHHYGWPGSGR